MKKKIFYALLFIIVATQLIRIHKNDGNLDVSTDISQVIQTPADIQKTLLVACYDCHSNKTNYPWYSNIQPLGWWLNHHVEEGVEHLNFSEFGDYTRERQAHKLEEIVEEVKEHEMPLSSYLIMHSEAKLTEEQTAALVSWAEKASASLSTEKVK
jgi:hypothetical protein